MKQLLNGADTDNRLEDDALCKIKAGVNDAFNNIGVGGINSVNLDVLQRAYNRNVLPQSYAVIEDGVVHCLIKMLTLANMSPFESIVIKGGIKLHSSNVRWYSHRIFDAAVYECMQNNGSTLFSQSGFEQLIRIAAELFKLSAEDIPYMSIEMQIKPVEPAEDQWKSPAEDQWKDTLEDQWKVTF